MLQMDEDLAMANSSEAGMWTDESEEEDSLDNKINNGSPLSDPSENLEIFKIAQNFEKTRLAMNK